MRQIDALRVLTCVSVIACHTVGNVYRPHHLTFGVGTLLLHYSREIFFFVSALVLVRSYVPRLDPEGRLPDPLKFRRRRLLLIGLPYATWTALYVMLAFWHTHRDRPLPQQLGHLLELWVYHLVTCSGWYHLYFLVVTLQFSMVFPLFLRLLRRTQGRHMRLLVCSYALQLVILAVYHLVGVPGQGLRLVLGDASLIAYQLWFIAGGLAGLHLERVHAWLVSHQRLVLCAVPVAAAALLGNFWFRLPAVGADHASSPFQPMMAVWSTVVFGGLYLAADRLSRLRSALAGRVLDHGARLSFGIFLAHPFVLDLVLWGSRSAGVFARSPWMLAVAFVLTLGGAVLLCALFDRTRLSLALIGRAPVDRTAKRATTA